MNFRKIFFKFKKGHRHWKLYISRNGLETKKIQKKIWKTTNEHVSIFLGTKSEHIFVFFSSKPTKQFKYINNRYKGNNHLWTVAWHLPLCRGPLHQPTTWRSTYVDAVFSTWHAYCVLGHVPTRRSGGCHPC